LTTWRVSNILSFQQKERKKPVYGGRGEGDCKVDNHLCHRSGKVARRRNVAGGKVVKEVSIRGREEKK